MQPITLASSHASTPEQAVAECLRQLDTRVPATSIGFLYVTDHLTGQLPDTLDTLRRHTGIPHWVGTVGIGICCTGQKYQNIPAIAVLVAEFPENSFRIFSTLQHSAGELDGQIKGWPGGNKPAFGIVHGDPHNTELPNLIEGLSDRIRGGFLVGGLTSSRGSHYQIAGDITEGGLSGILFTGDVPVLTALTQGCSPIGDQHEVTAAQDNIISKIDDRPALDVFHEEIGEILARDIRRVAGYIFAARPVRGSDRGDYTVRNLIGIDTQNRLLAVGDVFAPGDPILFCRRDSKTARDDMLRMLTDIRHRLNGRTARGCVYYSCLGRGGNLFDGESGELALISRELGGLPLVGFYANGEISHNRLYGYTGVLTLFL